jgi:molybdate transport system regulatory protein
MNNPHLQLADALGHGAADKRIDILRRIGVAGSISQAARDAGVSYKAAWQALETLSNLAAAVLVEKVVGGSGGGGARLTPAGIQLLQAADLLHAGRSDMLSRLHRGSAAGAAATPGLAALGLRTSMRNQLPCTVAALRARGPSVRVELRPAQGLLLAARVTRISAELLGLRSGLPVLALFKATAVVVAAKLPPRDGCNLLPGRVARSSRAAGGGEVSLALRPGLHLVGFAAAGHGLKAQQAAMAQVEESGVVIAVPG